MSVYFEKIDNELFFSINGEKCLCDKGSDKDDYDYLLEMGGSDTYSINMMADLLSSDYPDGLYLTDFYKSSNFSKLDWVDLRKKSGLFSCMCSINIDYKDWKSPFKVSDLTDIYYQKLIDLGYSVKLGDEEYGVSLEVTLKFVTEGFVSEIEQFATIAKHEYECVENNLLKKVSANVITKIFNFPKEYESACSQYLIWFGDLLRTLDIDADVSTENRNGHTFLTVDPKNNSELTRDIEKVLYSYLSLPYSEFLPANPETFELADKISFQLLQNQVQHFKSQIEMKNSIIELKDLANKTLKNDLTVLNNELLLLKSLQNGKLEVLDGGVSVSDIKIGPIVINPKKILGTLLRGKNV